VLPEAFSIALAASIYPPAVAAVIALGRGTDVRLRVLLFVLAALVTVYVEGAIILLVFGSVDASSGTKLSISAGLSIAIGLVALYVAWRLAHPGPPKPKTKGPSRTDRYLENRRLVMVLGVTLYILPSPVYLAAIKAVADTNISTTQQLAYLAAVVIVMLWLIEVPMAILLAAPARGSAMLESINAWFRRHGRTVAVVAAAAAGVYLIVVGIVDAAG